MRLSARTFALGTVQFLALAAALAPAPRPVAAQAAVCDPIIPQAPAQPLGYQPRGERCEGVYAQPVSAATLIVASFTQGPVRYAFDSHAPIQISWTAGSQKPTHLRARSLKRNVYYQMDSVQMAPPATFEWPADVLRALNLGSDEIGVLGWMTETLDEAARPVHLPLKVHQPDGPETDSDTYTLMLIPGVELKELQISIDQLDNRGRLVRSTVPQHPLKFGFYPPNRAIAIELPKLSEPGHYYLELTGERQDGLTISRDFYFLRSRD
ncbi:MAG: hypothetical protein WAS73_00600 [Defluviicoccus sp.]